MQTYYGKLLDKFLPPKMERKFHLGRRANADRRLVKEDLRHHDGGGFLDSQSERRNRENDRRVDDLHERRQRWFRTNKFQSRHF